MTDQVDPADADTQRIHLPPREPFTVMAPIEPVWVAYAKGKIGVHEIAGSQDNAYIVQILRACGISGAHDETPWCSAFVNDCMRVGALIEGTGKANARSWLDWGGSIASPRLGCIAVLDRPPLPWSGHVGFWVGESPTMLHLLGGNENNQVMIKDYEKTRLLSYRWPTGVAL